MSEDIIKGVFDQGIEVFKATLLLVEDQCREAIETVNVIKDPVARRKIKEFHQARLNMVETFRKALDNAHLPSFDQWLGIFDAQHTFPLEELSLEKEDLDPVLFKEDKDG